MRRIDAGGLASALASLPSLDTHALKARWRTLYSCEPPSHVSRGLLLRAIAYRMQENALGGLTPQTRQILSRVGTDASGAHTVAPSPAPRLSPGTRLVREWQGVTHQVLVLEDGVLYRGQHHRSLSVVARLITGSRWSGPLFFGLRAGPKVPVDAQP